ncbi:MAG: hypothetical protein ACYC67_27015 [Prosthecobacter sp.]
MKLDDDGGVTFENGMNFLRKLRHRLSGRSRRWQDANNGAIRLLADTLEQDLFDDGSFRNLAIEAISSSNSVAEMLIYQEAPNATLNVPFSCITMEKMHELHCCGLVLFMVLSMKLNKVAISFRSVEMLRCLCLPSLLNDEWIKEVSKCAGAPELHLEDLAVGFIGRIKKIFPVLECKGAAPLLMATLIAMNYKMSPLFSELKKMPAI